MEDKLIELLEAFGYPVFRQGSLAEDEPYPNSFFTFWNNETPEGTFYDNSNHSETGYFDVNFYSTDPALVYSKLTDAKETLKRNGFTITDSGHDVASDEQSHTGRGITVLLTTY